MTESWHKYCLTGMYILECKLWLRGKYIFSGNTESSHFDLQVAGTALVCTMCAKNNTILVQLDVVFCCRKSHYVWTCSQQRYGGCVRILLLSTSEYVVKCTRRFPKTYKRHGYNQCDLANRYVRSVFRNFTKKSCKLFITWIQSPVGVLSSLTRVTKS